MKKTFFFAAIISLLIFSACSKDDNNTNSGVKTIRYEFTTTTAGNFSIQAVADTTNYTEVAGGLNWSKTINVTGSGSAALTVFPPADWSNTSNEADVTLKIFVNNNEKASGNAHFIGLDRPNGLNISVSY